MKKSPRFVISDRAFSTIEPTNDLFGAHNTAGNNGGGIMFSIIGRDEGIGRRLTENLQKTTFAGMKQDPDAIMAFHWTDDENPYGTRGPGPKIGV